MRAPQYGKVRQRMPEGPNPEAAKGLRVKPFAKIFALVEGLGVMSLHRTEADAQTALEQEQERRSNFNKGSGDRAAPAETHEPQDAKADR
jgi:hypothetical protein